MARKHTRKMAGLGSRLRDGEELLADRVDIPTAWIWEALERRGHLGAGCCSKQAR